MDTYGVLGDTRRLPTRTPTQINYTVRAAAALIKGGNPSCGV